MILHAIPQVAAKKPVWWNWVQTHLSAAAHPGLAWDRIPIIFQTGPKSPNPIKHDALIASNA